MNQFNTSQTSILTHPLFIENHGKKTAAIAMDVDNDGQRIPDRIQDKDIMDTTLDYFPEAPSNNTDIEPPEKVQVAAATEAAPLSENSTEKDDGVQHTSKQMRKTPH